MTYDEALAYLSSLLTFNAGKNRERFLALLERLGDPHKQFRCIHVAGTNGKGSTTTQIAAILRAAGLRTGAYLSPYVFDVRERWMIDGAPIERDELVEQIEAIQPHIAALAETELGLTTEFELKTAIAFRWFAQKRVEVAVIEVGIGGRLDTTNVIDPPLAAAITSIGLDHTQLLGETLAAIASEKAGILKRGTALCVTPVADPEPRAVLEAAAAAVDVPLIDADPAAVPPGTTPSLRGPYQRVNAATAATVCRELGRRGVLPLTERHIRAGLEAAQLPGRFQVIARDGKTLILDVAHNAQGAAALRAALDTEFPGKRLTCVVGATRHHDPAHLLAELAPKLARVVATEPPFRPLPTAEVAAAAGALGLPVESVVPAAAAIEATFEALGPGEILLVTGSFYVVGETPEALR